MSFNIPPYIKISILALCSLTLLTLSGCDPFKSMSDEAQMVLKSKKGLVRDIQFDQSIDEIKAIEKLTVSEAFSNYLLYSQLLEGDTATKMEVEYFFNKQDQLDYVAINCQIPDSAQADVVREDLKGFLEKKYGPSEQDEYGWYVWEFKDEKGVPGYIEVELSSQTEEGQTGISLEFVKYYDFETPE